MGNKFWALLCVYVLSHPCSPKATAVQSVELQEIESKAKARRDEEVSDHIESDLNSFGTFSRS